MRIHDHTAAFFQFWEQASSLPLAERAELFEQMVVPASPRYYAHRFAAWSSDGIDRRAALTENLDPTPDELRVMSAVAARLRGSLEQALATFVQALPAFPDLCDVHIVHSLGELDGGIRVIDGENTFLLGIDMIARHHDVSDSTPFFHHELFHVYHLNLFDPDGDPRYDEDEILIALWMEGLATYVSSALNPSAGPRDLLLDVPRGAFAAYERVRGALAAGLAAALRTTDRTAYLRYFMPGPENPSCPPRGGYYIGFLVVREIAQGRTMDELARMTPSTFEPLVREALASLDRRATDDVRVES